MTANRPSELAERADRAVPPSAQNDDPLQAYLPIEHCPTCRTPASAARLYAASSPPAEAVSADRHGEFLSGYDPARIFFSYFQCPGCGTLFCRRYYRQSQLDGLYGRQAENMAALPLRARQRTQAAYVRLLRRHSRMRGNFLEIGADLGLFASACASAGAFDQFWLYEPNRAVHQALAERFAAQSHNIRADMFRAADVPAASISTAVMIHVLDHLLDPGDFLSEIRKSLEPGGFVLIVTHNCASLLARLLGRRWPPYTLQHPQLFSPRSLARLLHSRGFEVIEVIKTVNYFPLSYLVGAACTVAGLPAGAVPARETPMLGLKLGNIATIARVAG
jgi:2-polyprenyl-3-methyl-5-hydroxy-6-metoxy-1,4-benzoquinol methylase